MSINEDAMVVDHGSGIIKIGFAGEDKPRSDFPPVLGRPQVDTVPIMGVIPRETYVGEMAQSKRGILDLTYPMEHGVITNWDDMEKLWHYMFYDHVRVAPEELPWLLTEPPNNPKANREKLTEVYFEKFDVPAFYVSSRSVLSLYTSGRDTAVVVDSGDGVTYVIPVHEGNALPHAIERVDFGGRDLTQYLVKLLAERSKITFATSAEHEIAREMKERSCVVALNNKELMHMPEKVLNYELPDGFTVAVGRERFECPECVFDPSRMGTDFDGIHKLVYNSIMKCDVDVQQNLFSNVVLSGGSTMFQGMAERMQREIESLPLCKSKVTIKADPERQNLAWRGGSILASSSTFQDMWISKQEYEETGPTIVHKKCV